MNCTNTRRLGILCMFLSLPALTGCAGEDDSHSVPAVRVFAENGGWCWFQDERAVIHGDRLIFGSASGTGGGDIRVSVYDLSQNTDLGTVVLHGQFEQDDHDTPALFIRSDGSILAMYAKHFRSRDTRHYYRISQPDNPLQWGPEQTFDHGPGKVLTYMNLYAVPDERLLYCFYRDNDTYQPHYMVSHDEGATWRHGGHFIAHGLNARARPYVRYASNGRDAICFSFTEAHPMQFTSGCSIYYAAFRNGHFHRADGSLVKSLTADGPILPGEADLVFRGDSLNNAWTSSMELDRAGRPHIGYSVHKSDADNRYRYARWDGGRWLDMEVAYAGTCLYPRETNYTGLITLDPVDPRILYISTDVDPATGRAIGTGRYEIYRGVARDGAIPVWEPLTADSAVDNIRPVCVASANHKVLLWMRGRYTTFIDYDTDIAGMVLDGS